MTDEQRMVKLEQARRDIEDNLLVMAELEKRQSEVIRQLAQRQTALESGQGALAQEQEAQRKRNLEVDARIERLVSGIGEFIRRKE